MINSKYRRLEQVKEVSIEFESSARVSTISEYIDSSSDDQIKEEVASISEYMESSFDDQEWEEVDFKE